jgi:hypothetical protein
MDIVIVGIIITIALTAALGWYLFWKYIERRVLISALEIHSCHVRAGREINIKHCFVCRCEHPELWTAAD